MPHRKLKEMRKAAGKTVSEMADFLEITPPGYRRYERGEVDPKISQCIAISKFIGCKLEDIWGNTEDVPDVVDVSYKARPGQTVYVKVEYDDAEYTTPVRLKSNGESKNKKAKTA